MVARVKLRAPHQDHVTWSARARIDRSRRNFRVYREMGASAASVTGVGQALSSIINLRQHHETKQKRKNILKRASKTSLTAPSCALEGLN